MEPPAPGLFSITTGCPHAAVRRSPNVRARMSVALPAVNGTMMWMGLFGYEAASLCANAGAAASAAAAAKVLSSILLAFLRGPVLARRLGALELVGGLEARRHRGTRAGHVLVVVDVEHPQPALLSEREPDHAAELDELGLAEVLVHAIPERVVHVEAVGDRLGIGEGGLLPLVVALRLLELEQLAHVVFHEAAGLSLDRALVAAVLAIDRARDV